MNSRPESRPRPFDANDPAPWMRTQATLAYATIRDITRRRGAIGPVGWVVEIPAETEWSAADRRTLRVALVYWLRYLSMAPDLQDDPGTQREIAHIGDLLARIPR